MYKLYSMQRSGNSYKVRLALALLNAPYHAIEIDILHGESRTPDFLAKNPSGQVPLLEVADGRYLAESNAILWYVCGGTSLAPESRIERAEALQWMFFEQHALEPNIGAAYFWLSLVKGGRDLQTHATGTRPARARAWNPGSDVVPAAWIESIVPEVGVIAPTDGAGFSSAPTRGEAGRLFAERLQAGLKFAKNIRNSTKIRCGLGEFASGFVAFQLKLLDTGRLFKETSSLTRCLRKDLVNETLSDHRVVFCADTGDSKGVLDLS